MGENLDDILKKVKVIDIAFKAILTTYFIWAIAYPIKMYMEGASAEHIATNSYLLALVILSIAGILRSIKEFMLEKYVYISEEELNKYPGWVRNHVEWCIDGGRIKIRYLYEAKEYDSKNQL